MWFLKRHLTYSKWWLTGIAALFSLIMWRVGAWENWERLGYNLLFTIRNRTLVADRSWNPNLVVIAIDEKSLKAYGRFPWGRDRYVMLLDTLLPSPPNVLGFDILFSEPTSDDRALAQAMGFNGSVVLAVGVDANGQPIEVIPELARSVTLGHVASRSDADGIIRQTSLYIGQFPSLGMAMLQVYNRSVSNTILPEGAKNTHQEIALPQPFSLSKELSVWVNWPDSVSKLPTYSFVDVVEGKVAPDTFLNKLVLVGVTATGIDPMPTPFDYIPPTTGVYLHAAVIDNLLEDRFLSRLPNWVIVILLFAIANLTLFCIYNQSWYLRLLNISLLVIAWFTLSGISFSSFYLWLPVASPIGTILLVASTIQLREQYEKQQLMNLFSKLVAPETAQLIWQRKDEILINGKLEPQELTATILFMDIRGFTRISEIMTPKELIHWLNLYLEKMSNCIIKHGGVIDKYIGDMIMAVFGIPFAKTTEAEIQADALNAIAASMEMHQCLGELNESLQNANKPLIRFGIGIHTGLVVAGSVGSSQRLNYSVVGDAVNIAARLEALNKDLTRKNPYHILVSDRTFNLVQDYYHAQAMGSVNLRGKTIAMEIYAILAEKTFN